VPSPQNRDPKPEEIEACFPFLKKQLEVIRPVLSVLGNLPPRPCWKQRKDIKAERKIYEFNHIKIVPTFHPASLLRNPEWKREVWQDMQLIQKLLEDNA
jgi:DNA polymerase